MLRKRKNKVKRSQLYIVGSLLIIISLTILSLKFYCFYIERKVEKDKVNNFYEIQQEIKDTQDKSDEVIRTSTSTEYMAVLKIASINLEKGLYSIDNSLNNVDYNIEVLSNSAMPDVENGNFILASHNGNGKTSYFRNLYKVSIGDYASVFYNGVEYQYQVINTYKVDKTGKINIIRNKEKTTLTLITCSGEDKQLVVVCELVNKI